jgi:c-di-GMP phosphodiesterase
MTNTFLGVQPIFDRKRQVVAYELLFRDETGGFGDSALDGDSATSQVIINAFADIGVDRLGRDKRLFVNFTEGLLASEIIQTLPAERVVLEILETVQVTPQLVEALQRLVRQGFQVALDDFVYDASWDPVLKLSHIVKLDVLGADRAQIRAKIDSLPRLNRPTLLAEKVEDQAQFETCLVLGFELFQGYYLAKPQVIAGKRPPSNKLRVLQLLAKLQDDSISLQDVEKLISQDVALSYRVLRIMGSAAVSQGRTINDLRQAIVLVGLRAIRHWAALIALSSLDSQNQYSITRSLTYARFCQIVGERHLHAEKDALFTVGIFSNLDEILEIPLPEALKPLPLDERLKGAILRQEGILGQVLLTARRFEFDSTDAFVPPSGLDMATLSSYFLDAFAWAQEIQAQIKSSATGH